MKDIKEIKDLESLKIALMPFYERYKYQIMAVGVVLVLLLDYFLIMRPQLSSLTKLTSQNKIISDEVTRIRNDGQGIGQYQRQIDGMNKQMTLMHLKVRRKEETSYVLERITSLASKKNIKIEQVGSDAKAESQLLDINDGQYLSLPMVVHASGSFHNFGYFINAIESDEIHLQVSDFVLAANPADINNHAIKLTINTIIYQEKTDEDRKVQKEKKEPAKK